MAKTFGDSFEATDLEAVLAERSVGHLYVAGAKTDACIRSTIHGALTRGYDVTLVGDAHTTEDQREWGAPAPEAVIANTNLYWAHQRAPGRTARVLAADVAAEIAEPRVVEGAGLAETEQDVIKAFNKRFPKIKVSMVRAPGGQLLVGGADAFGVAPVPGSSL